VRGVSCALATTPHPAFGHPLPSAEKLQRGEGQQSSSNLASVNIGRLVNPLPSPAPHPSGHPRGEGKKPPDLAKNAAVLPLSPLQLLRTGEREALRVSEETG